MAKANVAALLYVFDKGLVKDGPLRERAGRMPRVLTCDNLGDSKEYVCWACAKVRDRGVHDPQPCTECRRLLCCIVLDHKCGICYTHREDGAL